MIEEDELFLQMKVRVGKSGWDSFKNSDHTFVVKKDNKY